MEEVKIFSLEADLTENASKPMCEGVITGATPINHTIKQGCTLAPITSWCSSPAR